jgi:hypothetical protein
MRKLIAMILLVAMVLTCVGCTVASEEITETTTKTEPDFTVERANADTAMSAGIYIITDTKTGDRYMFVKAGYGGGLTKMEE